MGLRKSTGVWEGVGAYPGPPHVLGCWGGCWDLGEIPAELGKKVSQGFPHSWVHKGFSLQTKKGLSPSVDADGNRDLFSGIVK